MDFEIDFSCIKQDANCAYRGFGMVSGNNSSRLLMDYKLLHPDVYWQILELLFSKKYLGISHLKLEMGSDVNSTSGTEPATMRSAKESCNVYRGAGFILAKDAKSIAKDLTLDMLWWSEPLWVTRSSDVYGARYNWYKQNLISAYNEFGLIFDYVSANQNERAIDDDWIIYLAEHLKQEKNAPYDFSCIKVVSADEDNAWWISSRMLNNKRLLDAVSVVGSHYTSESSKETRELFLHHGKSIWYTEGSPPMTFDEELGATNKGFFGVQNGVLDTVNRFIAMVYKGDMTLYEFQPVVSAYYDGVTFCHKQLLCANEPWSGFVHKGAGYLIFLHIARFLKVGFFIVPSACFADGKKVEHCIIDTKYSVLTLANPATKDFSILMCNQTSNALEYNFCVKNCKNFAKSELFVYTSSEGTVDDFAQNFFCKQSNIVLTPTKDDGVYTFSVKVLPASLVTISTLQEKFFDDDKKDIGTSKVMTLPYKDDFNINLKERGGAPLFMTDIGGAFEIASIDKNLANGAQIDGQNGAPSTNQIDAQNGAPSTNQIDGQNGGQNCLVQQITQEQKALDWGFTPEPVTNFGDDRFTNYSISADICFAKTKIPAQNYVGVGLYYTKADCAKSGWWAKITEDNKFFILYGSNVACEGRLLDALSNCAKNCTQNFTPYNWHNVELCAKNYTVTLFYDGKKIASFDNAIYTNASCTNNANVSARIVGQRIKGSISGRASLYSAFFQNRFARLRLNPCNNLYAITRLNNTSARICYSGNVEHLAMTSFKHYKRTCTKFFANASLCFLCKASTVALYGKVDDEATISILVDKALLGTINVSANDFKEALCIVELDCKNFDCKKINGANVSGANSDTKSAKEYEVELVVKSGTVAFDYLEYV